MKIALIGLGEVGGIIAGACAQQAVCSAFDLKFLTENTQPAVTARKLGVRVHDSHDDAVDGADIIISAVTAAQTWAAAAASLRKIAVGAWYLDLNSASPGVKTECASLINAAGGRYVEAAVMSPFPQKGCASPIITGGPHAQAFSSIAVSLGFVNVSVFSDVYGQASAAKLCRSVIVKGIEALLIESLLSASHYGVEDAVLASLSDLFPGCDWPTLSSYMISRAIEHGARRAEEMREAAVTVSDAGIAPLLATATAARQEWAAGFQQVLCKGEPDDLLDRFAAAKGTIPR